MGDTIAGYFDKAKLKGGISAQVKLAMLTKMSQSQARTQPDSPENIKMFEEAMTKL